MYDLPILQQYIIGEYTKYKENQTDIHKWPEKLKWPENMTRKKPPHQKSPKSQKFPP